MSLQSVAEVQRQVLERVEAAWATKTGVAPLRPGLSSNTWLGKLLDRGSHFEVRWKKAHRIRPLPAPSVASSTATPAQRDRDGVAAWQLKTGLRP